jgi:hypothetical protein
MSDDGPEWFAPKRYGYGASVPISWQGWLITIAFLALVAAITLMLKDRPLAFIAAIIPPALAFVLVAARTTRGGWRWRWGDKD